MRHRAALAAQADARLWWLTLAAICAMLLAPLFITEVPPLLDYPNHLARAWLLAFGSSDPVLSKIYIPHWAIIPNLATDIIWPPLMHILPVHVAGRIVVGLLVLLPVPGTAAYHRAIFGARSWWPLASALVAYNASVLLGFLNFAISLGAALLFAAAWIHWRNTHPIRTILLATLGSVVLFFCHLMGLIFFVLLIGSFELECTWRTPRAFTTRLLAILPVLAAPAWLYLLTNLKSARPNTYFLPPAEKAAQLLIPFVNYDRTLDIATAAAVLTFLALCAATRRAIVTPTSAIALLATAALYAASPYAFKGTAGLDARFAIMLGFLLFAAIRPAPLPRAALHLAAPLLTFLFIARMAVLATAWNAHNADIAGLRAATATLKPGDRVYLTAVTPEEAPAYWNHTQNARRLSNGFRTDYHLPALVLIEHHAFWPYLFAEPAQQPIELNPTYQSLAEQEVDLPPHTQLAACTPTGPLTPANIAFRGYNYILMLEAGGDPNAAHFATKRLTLVANTDMAALYRIKSPIPECAMRVSAF